MSFFIGLHETGTTYWGLVKYLIHRSPDYMGISMRPARETDEKWCSIWIEFAKKQGPIKKVLAIVVVFR